MHRYEVGQSYVEGRTNWPERGEYNYRAGMHELRLLLSQPTVGEIEAVKTGRADFALRVERDIIFLLYRFGEAIPWSDAPYSWHLVQRAYPDQATLPAPHGSPEGRDTVQVILVDAGAGIIKAIRVLSWSPAFTAAIRGAIRDQAARSWPGDDEYDRQLANAYRRWPTSAAMVRDASARTRGGD